MKRFPKKHRTLMSFALLTVAGLPMVLAAVPRAGRSHSSDTSIYQELHEVNLPRANSISFEKDIERLSAQEKSHREVLPLRISAPMDRVMNTPYRAGSGAKIHSHSSDSH